MQTVAGYNYKIKAKVNGKTITFEATENLEGNIEIISSDAYPEQEIINIGGWSEFKKADEDILSKK